MEQRLRRPLIVLALQAAAYWPVWVWYASRVGDGSDEPWCLAALAVVLVLLLTDRDETKTQLDGFRAPIVFLLLYVVAAALLPPIFGAAVAMLAVGSTLSFHRRGRLFDPGIWGLLLLSLPLLASLQFYLGYPLRALAGQLTAPLLNLSGFAVAAQGTVLDWGGRLIEIDAPCSGVRLLWACGFLTFSLASIYRLTAFRTVLAGLGALAALVLGNVFRTAALFYVEAGVVAAPQWAHAWAGVAAFALMAVVILGHTGRLREVTQ
jgi:exosortase/archaeosortase family protein